ncbi:SRPBCC domain-containing protein [Phyllobacterium sp. 628]|uniref:SRPBCC family protein n=1 Tax=Phyllobacterium sp. 628 TaxID=2718938 RepID=UPI0016624375|nr:SRPBCC domain-containing protein [Phyllobacterium sp. 628]QND50794.1 SRPBCC domain-containing protein [Phyllobacterium sp. 628]
MAVAPSLMLKRHLKAPPSLVWAAWTDPSMIVRWWGPAGAKTLKAEAEPRVGGKFHIVFQTPDREQHDISGIYCEVIVEERLAFTWVWITLPDRESLVTLVLKGVADGTLLTLIHEKFHDVAARDRHAEGWDGALDSLTRFVNQMAVNQGG